MTSAIHTIRLRRITSVNQTLIEVFVLRAPFGSKSFLTTLLDDCFPQWITDFSSDVTTSVIEDNRLKKLDAFADLAKAVAAKPE